MSHLSLFREKMKADHFDSALIYGKENQFYLCNFFFDDGLLLITESNAYLLTDDRYSEGAKKQASTDFEVIVPENGFDTEVALLLTINHAKNVLLEESISVLIYNHWKEKLFGKTVYIGADEMLLSLRAVKDEKELDKIAKAQEITDTAFFRLLSRMTPTMTERDVALELEYEMKKQGATGFAFETIAVSGSQSALPHGKPRNIPLQKGFLTMDFGAQFDGYCSDMTRTVCVGKATDEMKRLYATVLNAQTNAWNALKSGERNCYTLDKIARDTIDSSAFKGKFTHSLGHGVGLYIHEKPNLSTRVDRMKNLIPGNVVTLEPGIYVEGKYGCRIEDMVYLDLTGNAMNFTKSPKDLVELFV